MNKKLILLFLLIIIIITNCNNSPTPKPELPVIKVGWIAWAGMYPIVLVKELGLDVKHGFQIEPIFNKDISDDNNDWETGKVDASFADLDQVVRRNSQKADLAKVIFIADRSGGDVVVTVPEIKTIADLKGKRIGTIVGATYGELMIRRMLEAHGVSIKEVELVNMDGSNVPDAMPKLIDAGATWEPHLSKAKAKGFTPLYSSAEDPTLPLSAVLIVRTEIIKAHPEAVRGLVAAWFEAVAIWTADPAKYSPMVAKIVGAPAEEIANDMANFITLEQNITRFQDGSIVKEAQNASDFLISTGQLNRVPKIEELFDGSFLKP